jgi:hypothetical protein
MAARHALAKARVVRATARAHLEQVIAMAMARATAAKPVPTANQSARRAARAAKRVRKHATEIAIAVRDATEIAMQRVSPAPAVLAIAKRDASHAQSTKTPRAIAASRAATAAMHVSAGIAVMSSGVNAPKLAAASPAREVRPKLHARAAHVIAAEGAVATSALRACETQAARRVSSRARTTRTPC